MNRDEQRRLLLEQRAIEELRERIAEESYLTTTQVCERLHVSREKLSALPFEVLPYVDVGLGTRSMKRYHPRDVLASDAKLRAWKRAQDRGEGEAYLARLREELEARDQLALEAAGVA